MDGRPPSRVAFSAASAFSQSQTFRVKVMFVVTFGALRATGVSSLT